MARQCEFVNISLRYCKNDDGDFEVMFRRGELAFNDPDSSFPTDVKGSTSNDTSGFTFNKTQTVEAMTDALVAAMKTDAGIS
jgi:hypothetical protein